MNVRQLLASSSFALLAALSSTSAQAYSQLVVFGDSLSDNGNVARAVGGALPASPYYQGRFSNGPVAVEVMAQQLGVSLDDRAYGGAYTGASTQLATSIPPLANTGMLSQVAAYTTGKTVDANALYVLWGGGNDFLSVLASGNPTAIYNAGHNAILNLAGEVGTLYAAGAREFFLPTLADFAFTYYGTSGTDATRASLSGMTASFNAGLGLALGQLSSAHGDIRIHTFDTNAFLTGLRTDLAASGGNLVDRCWTGSYLGAAAAPGVSACANPGQYFLFDSVHPTAFVHNAIGTAFAASVPEPTTMGLALVGLLGLMVMQRRRRD